MQSLAFDPVIDPTKTAAENAQAIVDQAKATSACIQTNLTGATATLTYPPPAGCTIQGVTVIGTFSMSVTKDASGVTVDVTFTNLSVNGTTVNGSVKLVTSSGTTFTVTPNLTSGSKSISGSLSVTGGSGYFTIAGTLTTRAGDASTTATLTNIKWTTGACYPEAGTASFKSSSKLSPTITVTFLSTTPQDGKVSVTKGKVPSTESLPAYASCPPA